MEKKTLRTKHASRRNGCGNNIFIKGLVLRRRTQHTTPNKALYDNIISTSICLDAGLWTTTGLFILNIKKIYLCSHYSFTFCYG